MVEWRRASQMGVVGLSFDVTCTCRAALLEVSLSIIRERLLESLSEL